MKKRKGIILAGGSGTRLYPLTQAISKQLLSGIREILLITTPHDRPLFQRQLGDGSQWGIRSDYAEQPTPGGLAQAYLIADEWLGGASSCLVLGDNIFYGHGFTESLRRADARTVGASVFGYWVRDPERYGVAEFDDEG